MAHLWHSFVFIPPPSKYIQFSGESMSYIASSLFVFAVLRIALSTYDQRLPNSFYGNIRILVRGLGAGADNNIAESDVSDVMF